MFLAFFRLSSLCSQSQRLTEISGSIHLISSLLQSSSAFHFSRLYTLMLNSGDNGAPRASRYSKRLEHFSGGHQSMAECHKSTISTAIRPATKGFEMRRRRSMRMERGLKLGDFTFRLHARRSSHWFDHSWNTAARSDNNDLCDAFLLLVGDSMTFIVIIT